MNKLTWLVMMLAAFNVYASDNYFDDYLVAKGFHKIVFPFATDGRVVERVGDIAPVSGAEKNISCVK